MKEMTSFLAGLLFGLGLLLADMVNPAKVQGFLDLAGPWDPSLAVVMVGAIAVGLLAFSLAKGRTVSLLGEPMRLPTSRDIDRRLVLGSMAFGLGWGLAGLCPGPALVLVGAGVRPAGVFFVAMIVGMAAYEAIEHRRGQLRQERVAHRG
ncbi:MAG TPA: YeeE/YedE family protein [Burkholderiaceae bacterium]|nr:YeeE/YedE family protein [Burkholderiaceae bacterium]